MKLTIKNYQGHEDSTLEFVSPGINAIVGPNGHGKSSVIRAMKAVPLGDTLDRRHGTRETRVDIDGCTKAFVKTKGRYEIDGIIYEAMRNAVPKQVTDRLQLGPVNFRSQHQPYFLLSDSPGAVARAMNELTDLGVIDYVASSLRSEGRILTDIRKAYEADLYRERARVSALDWAVEANEDLQVIEGAKSLEETLFVQVSALQEISTQVFALQEKLSKLPPTGLIEEFTAVENRVLQLDTDQLEKLITEVEGYSSWLAAVPDSMDRELELSRNRLSKLLETGPLETLLARVTEYALDLEQCPDPKSDIDSLSAVSLPDCSELEALVAEVSKLEADRARLQGIEGWQLGMIDVQAAISAADFTGRAAQDLDTKLSALGRILTNKVEAELRYSMAEAEFNTLLKEAEVCPLCGGGTNETCLHS